MTDLAGKIVASKWQLETRLGQGTFGEVWIARHLVTGRQKALKLLYENYSASAEFTERFVAEARACARTDSPHVVGIDDIGFDAALSRSYLVMELLRGETLYDYLVRAPYAMPPGEALLVLRQIAAALDAAHAAGVVHRDLKPENVVLSWRADGGVLVKVLDFGIAKLAGTRASLVPLAPDRTADHPARTVGFIGTPGYAAPEQIADAGSVTAATDIFALGVCSFEMLTGSAYWRGQSPIDLFAEVAAGVTDPPSQRAPRGVTLPPAYDAWFARACHLDPSQRFASAGEAVAALEECLGHRDPLPPPRPRSAVPQIAETDGQRRVVAPLAPTALAAVSPPAHGPMASGNPTLEPIVDLRPRPLATEHRRRGWALLSAAIAAAVVVVGVALSRAPVQSVAAAGALGPPPAPRALAPTHLRLAPHAASEGPAVQPTIEIAPPRASARLNAVSTRAPGGGLGPRAPRVASRARRPRAGLSVPAPTTTASPRVPRARRGAVPYEPPGL